jgi:hypothetical protein
VARAQRPAMPVIGFLHAGSPEENVKRPTMLATADEVIE